MIHPEIIFFVSNMPKVFTLLSYRAAIIDAMFDDVEDTFKAIKGWLGEGRDVIAASLDVLAVGHLSPVVKRLLELVPDVRYVRAACEVRSSSRCDRKNARFTMIFKKSGEPYPREELPDVIPDDGSVIYKPACRRCYYGL